MRAVLKTGGKQYYVKEGDLLDIDRIKGEEGADVVFSEVLSAGEGADIKIGAPVLEGATVKARIVNHLRGPKLLAFKMKRRKGYRKRKGHRQELSRIRVTEISLP